MGFGDTIKSALEFSKAAQSHGVNPSGNNWTIEAVNAVQRDYPNNIFVKKLMEQVGPISQMEYVPPQAEQKSQVPDNEYNDWINGQSLNTVISDSLIRQNPGNPLFVSYLDLNPMFKKRYGHLFNFQPYTKSNTHGIGNLKV
jgi:hypothetical protein